MKLLTLLKNISYELIKGNTDIEITDISYDSRTITDGVAFVALIGIDSNGHDYIDDAIKKGSKCLFVCQEVTTDANVTIIKLDDTRRKLAYLSANLFNNPADKLIKIAITGTKGKTSVSWMLKSILEQSSKKVGVIGTVGTVIDGKTYLHKNTTPESYQIQKSMRDMVDKGTTYLIMETSSQALKVGRISNIIFEYGIFTNLSIDHVGPREHPSFEDYAESKALLFKQCQIGIMNKDDLEFPNMIKDATCKIYTYGKNSSNLSFDTSMAIHNQSFLGTEFHTTGLIDDNFRIQSPGEFSVYNAMPAIIVSKLIKIDTPDIKKGLESFSVEGRCEIINVNNKFKVIIDFAHNKISMESILKTINEYHHNHLITVFGCGGGRSYERRYELGETSGRLANLSIVTTDNPRNDNIDDINRDIVKGIIDCHGEYIIIKDRKEAINYALNNARKNDIILLLGKGHEKYQEIKGTKTFFDERIIIKEFMESR